MARLTLIVTDAAAPEIYTLSLHDALPILAAATALCERVSTVYPDGWTPLSNWSRRIRVPLPRLRHAYSPDRKSTRLNSSHGYISYAVFCLKKKIESAGSVPVLPSRVRDQC